MGVASADYSLDGREDLFVTNSRRQLHAVYRSSPTGFADARPDFAPALGTDFTGWGVSWIDLDLDGNLDLVLANGAIPIKRLAMDAERLQVLENQTGEGRRDEFADAGDAVGVDAVPPQQRPWSRRGRLRQRRRRGRRGQLDRRAPAPAPERRRRRPLARGAAEPLCSRHDGHGRAAGRAKARPRGARRRQLPLVGGSARPLRARVSDEGRRARRARIRTGARPGSPTLLRTACSP